MVGQSLDVGFVDDAVRVFMAGRPVVVPVEGVDHHRLRHVVRRVFVIAAVRIAELYPNALVPGEAPLMAFA